MSLHPGVEVLRAWSAETVGRVELPQDVGDEAVSASRVAWSWTPADPRADDASTGDARTRRRGWEAQVLAALAAIIGRWSQSGQLEVGLLAPSDGGTRTALAPLPLGRGMRLSELIERSRSALDALDALPPVASSASVRVARDGRSGATIGFASGAPDGLLEPGTGFPPWDLALNLEGWADGRLEGALYAAEGTLSRAQLDSLGEALGAVLDAGRELRLEDLPTLPPSMEARVADWARGRKLDVSGAATVVSLFLDQVQRTPHARAVEFEGRGLSYEELERTSRGLARRLIRDGVSPGECVGVLLAPGLETVVALLGVLRAGGAYVPLDPEAPVERLRSILGRARATRVLTQEALRPVLSEAFVAYALDAELEALTTDDGGALPAVLAGQLAYVVFTSGSTGEPKGVMVPHSALANHAQAASARFGLRSDDRVLQFTPLCFDAAGEEIYPALSVGAAVRVRGELVAAAAFRELIEQDRLTVLSLPPAYLHECLEVLERTGQHLPQGLRTLILGGERILPETLARWNRLGGGRARIFNVYGPTEATITAVLHELPPDADWEARDTVDMGTPLENVRTDVVDPGTLARVPPGSVGELLISGAGLAFGYLDAPDLTAERFLPDPFATEPGARVYRTGDLCRWTSNGILRFVGRADGQLKIRGMRVEIGEVEAALLTLPGVRDVVVVARELGGSKQLVGYAVPERGGELAPALLRSGLTARLPSYMVPAAFVILEALPLTANGKVDVRGLPDPVPAGHPDAHPAATPLEASVQAIWTEVLGVPVPGRESDFFELGGHSLAAIQVLSRIETEHSVFLSLEQVFDAPTVVQLAEVIEREQRATSLEAGDVDGMSDAQVEAMLLQLSQSGR